MRAVHRFKSGAWFSTWLFRIHLNVCYDALRKRRRAPTDQLAIDPADRAATADPHLAALQDKKKTLEALLPEHGLVDIDYQGGVHE